jgi:DNA repair exonuclease SbcCD ATPase subunit
MSGSPKYSRAELERQRQEELERQRRERAAAEERRRKEAEAREKKRRLENRRTQVQQQAETFKAELSQQQANLYPEAAQTLQQQLQQYQQTIQTAQSEPALQEVSQHLEQLQQQMQGHIAQKRRDDEEKKRKAELDRQQFTLEELQRQLAQIPDGRKFAPESEAALAQNLQNVKQAIQTGNPATVRQPLQVAEQALEQHRQRVADRRAEWQRRQAQAEQHLGDLQALVAGLQADPVVMQWQPQEVAQLATQIEAATAAITSEQFEQVGEILATCQQQSQSAIKTANAAQLKADQRDYIADSIAQSLESLGFSILTRQAEHPDNPASAVILGAATYAGKGISVSVPVEGEVFYDVEGYSKNTEAAVGGGSAATCDEAEAVLNEMGKVLETEFGVQMGEVQWEGKDPNRKIHQADSLPRSQSSRSRTA